MKTEGKKFNEADGGGEKFQSFFVNRVKIALIKGEKHFVTLFDKAPLLTRIDVEVPMDFFPR